MKWRLSRYAQDLILFVLTIISIRVVLYLFTFSQDFVNSDVMYQDSLHHYYFGVLLVAIGYFSKNSFIYASKITSIGMALIVDEFFLPLFYLGFFHCEYWDWKGLSPAITGILIATYLIYREIKSNSISAPLSHPKPD